ncbi:MAG: hypothetical protein M3Q52_00890 [Pseudomonadota bacterium]|nr:hypothetical protein [Pseudomonadota bacterium]
MTADERAVAPAAALDEGPLSFLPRAIREPRQPLLAIIIGWLTAFVPAIALGAAVQFVLPDAPKPDLAITGGYAIFRVTVFAPVVETLIMAAVLALLLLFLPPTAAILVSAVGWGVAHSLAAAAWGLVIWWPFLIFSTLFVVWRNRSLLLALAIPTAAHALNNLIPSLLILCGVAT